MKVGGSTASGGRHSTRKKEWERLEGPSSTRLQLAWGEERVHLHAATPLMIFLGLLHKAVRRAAVSDLGEGRATSKFYILILQLVG